MNLILREKPKIICLIRFVFVVDSNFAKHSNTDSNSRLVNIESRIVNRKLKFISF
jgi:hypothetical protein